MGCRFPLAAHSNNPLKTGLVMIPRWYEIALGEIGQKEQPGSLHNQRIIEYHATTTLKATDDETPWCASFVNWCLYHAGSIGTRKANARSFLEWGSPLQEPKRGCIVVFSRGASQTAGHVAFYDSDHGDLVRVLGGNQGDKVSYASYPKSSVLGYRWPA